MRAQGRIAICAPIFNEEDGILDFLSKVDAAAGQIASTYPDLKLHMILVDDGSRDRGPELALDYQAKSFHELQLVRLSRNFGHASAVTALFEEAADYHAMILMDADLQDTPTILPKLVSAWVGGKDSVRVVRGRRAEGFLFSIFSKTFYRTFEKLSGLQSGIGNFGLYDERVVSAVRSYPERVRYFPGIITLAGFSTELIQVDRHARAKGESRVGFKGLLRLAMTALFSFSTVPIQVMAVMGFFFSLLAVIGGFIAIYVRIFTTYAIPGWASFLTAQFFFGGLTVFCLGVIGQYIGIIFEEVKARPIFIKREKTVKSFSRET